MPVVPPLKDTAEGYEAPVDPTTDGLAAQGFYPQVSSTPDATVGIERDGSGNLILKDPNAGSKTLSSLSAASARRVVGITLAGSPITTGVKGAGIRVPFAGTIVKWTVLADAVGSIVVDVWKDTLANYPPTVADSIAGSEKPTLSSQRTNEDSTLSTWTTAVSAGDVILFNVESVSGVTKVTIEIEIAL